MKKQSTTKQILNILNTQGGKKPKQLIALTKASSASVYNALHQLRSKKMIAKEEDGVYISQTQKSVSKVTNKNGWKTVLVNVSDKSFNDKYTKSLETQVHELEKLHSQWRQNYKKLEDDYTQAKIMYLDSQAVVKYLEEKVAQLIKG
jgi:DNA-binding MarR family transcriptional regulator